MWIASANEGNIAWSIARSTFPHVVPSVVDADLRLHRSSILQLLLHLKSGTGRQQIHGFLLPDTPKNVCIYIYNDTTNTMIFNVYIIIPWYIPYRYNTINIITYILYQNPMIFRYNQYHFLLPDGGTGFPAASCEGHQALRHPLVPSSFPNFSGQLSLSSFQQRHHVGNQETWNQCLLKCATPESWRYLPNLSVAAASSFSILDVYK